LVQRKTTPLVTLSPAWGMMMSFMSHLLGGASASCLGAACLDAFPFTAQF
jgi:hypothetical protein